MPVHEWEKSFDHYICIVCIVNGNKMDTLAGYNHSYITV